MTPARERSLSSPSKQIIVPEPKIRPRKPITRAEIVAVVRKHKQLCRLGRSALERAWEIGAKLRYWDDLIPHGQRLPWRKENIPEISKRSAQVYLQLLDNKEVIEAHLKSAESAHLDEQFTIKDARDFISSHKAVEVNVKYETRSIRAVSYISPESEEASFLRPSVSSTPMEQSTQDATELQDTTETAPQTAIQSTPCPASKPRDDLEWFALTCEQLERLCPDCRKLLEEIRES